MWEKYDGSHHSPLVDEDWHAICQALFQGVEGPEWEAMYHQDKDLHEARNPANRKVSKRRNLKPRAEGEDQELRHKLMENVTVCVAMDGERGRRQ